MSEKQGPQDRPIVERDFERDEKDRLIQVCDLCGEIRARKTKGEGRCCMRTTHKWLPLVKKYDIGNRVVFKSTGDRGTVIAKGWDSDGIRLRVHFDDMGPDTWGEYYTKYFELLEETLDA